MECPKCKIELGHNAIYCGCGWQASAKSASVDRYHGCCEWVSGSGRCHYAGSLSNNTRGGGPWYCRWHDGCADPAIGDEIVIQSHREIPRPGYGLEARRRFAVRQWQERMKRYSEAADRYREAKEKLIGRAA